MDWKEMPLTGNDAGRRIDRILFRLMPEKKHSELFSALRKGLFLVNGKKVLPSYIAGEGDVLKAAAFLLNSSGYKTEEKAGAEKSSFLPLEEIYKNAHLLFINKSAGVDVQSKDFLFAAKATLPKEKSLSFSAAPLHRLDRWTSGLLAVSQSIKGAKWFSENINSRSIKKFYLGIVCGRLASFENWRDFLKKEDAPGLRGFYRMQVSDGGKFSETDALPLKYGKTEGGLEVTLVRFQIHTGTKHQIRLQAASRGFPLLFDTAYGGKKDKAGGRHFFLHAGRLEFPENPLGLPEFLEAPLPEDFKKFIDECF